MSIQHNATEMFKFLIMHIQQQFPLGSYLSYYNINLFTFYELFFLCFITYQ